MVVFTKDIQNNNDIFKTYITAPASPYLLLNVIKGSTTLISIKIHIAVAFLS